MHAIIQYNMRPVLTIGAFVCGVILLGVPSVVAAQQVPQQTLADIAQRIERLRTRIDQLEEERSEGRSASADALPRIDRTLSFGDRGQEVKDLQTLLNKVHDIQVAPAGFPGCSGRETRFFGSGTLEAVKAFQEKYPEQTYKAAGDQKPSGYVDEHTRRHLNRVAHGEADAQGGGRSQ